MFGSKILEVAIGVIFVLLLVSVICTAIREWLESIFKARAAFLEHGIRELLHDRGAVGLARHFFTHPLVYGLYARDYVPGRPNAVPTAFTRGGHLPSYIPARNFAFTMLDIAARGSQTLAATSGAESPVLSLAVARANIANIENPHVQRALITAIDTAQGDMDRAVANIAAWYDSAMDRVSGGYKRATQHILFVIGLAVAVGLNVNVIAIGQYLYRDDAARAAVVARAEAAARDSSLIRHDTTGSDARKSYVAARAALDSLQLPIGWDRGQARWPWRTTVAVKDTTGAVVGTKAVDAAWWDYFVSPLVGWLLTALAATLGAPFWFDLLNKVMVIRSTVKPHEKSPEESSDDGQRGPDRQRPAAAGATGDLPGDPAPPPRAPAPADAPGSAAVAATAPPTMPVPPVPPVPPATSAVASHGGHEDQVDGCDASVERETEDHELPPAFGGVA